MPIHFLLKVLLVAGSYLLGAIPFGILVGRAFSGVDVRDAGSGNIGATNVARTAGRWAGIVTLLLDIAKGAVAVIVAIGVLSAERSVYMDRWIAVVGLAAFLGHVFPIWLNFQGGKGVATAAGVFLVLDYRSMIFGGAVFLVAFAVTRGVASVGSLLGSLTTVIAMIWIFGLMSPLTWACAAIVAIIFWRHRGNIYRIWQRAELKV